MQANFTRTNGTQTKTDTPIGDSKGITGDLRSVIENSRSAIDNYRVRFQLVV